ncbi:PAS domain-containing protein [Galbibacter mesophilus]|uniref:PAS domain-containing protein n=1 Tax=Galbibacter mesophilus TaxID=379069 RepID=UPI00191F2BA8|nr:PAS domain-containing protein [Galbibacter mesophilus]MCM5663790.1 PAS domain-containing protein [Galbibacter mesophilus]
MKNDLKNMMCLDICLPELEKEKKITTALDLSSIKSMPLVSWDFFSLFHWERLQGLKKSAEIEQIQAFAEKFGWRNDIPSIFNSNDYEALVVTNSEQDIVWVNDGFVSMTGYSKKFAINKNPKFLQGEGTTESSRQNFKKQLLEDTPFKEVIVNYKKDNTPYKCEIKIFPLYSEQTTHYLALEREVV